MFVIHVGDVSQSLILRTLEETSSKLLRYAHSILRKLGFQLPEHGSTFWYLELGNRLSGTPAMLVLLFVAFATMKQLQCHTKGHEQNYLELYTSPYDTTESGCLLSRTPSWMAFRELWMTLRFLLSLIFCQGCPIQMSVKEVTKLVPGLNFSV